MIFGDKICSFILLIIRLKKNKMKRIVFVFMMVFGIVFHTNAQKFRGLDKSPLDVVSLKESREASPIIKIYYSRPQKKGREIFGGIVPYGKVWRLGANESTEITFFQDLVFGGKKIVAGTYGMYAIPNEKEWTIILNKKLNGWGSYTYQKDLDIARVKTPVLSHVNEVEAFSMAFSKIKENKSKLFFVWGTTKIKIPIEL